MGRIILYNERVNYVFLLLLSVAFIAINCLIGGTRLLFSFPSYALIGTVAVLSIAALRRPIPKPSIPALISAVLLALYVIGRALWSPLQYLAWPDLFMAAAGLAVYLLTALCLTDARHRIWLVVVLFAIAITDVIVGIIQFTGDHKFMLFGFGRNVAFERACGMFISGNHLAGYLETIGIIALSITCWSRWPLPAKLVAGYLALMCYLGVAISGSRGGFLSSAFSLVAFAGLSLWMVHTVDRKKTAILTVSVIAVFLVGGGIGSALLWRSNLIRSRFSQDATQDIRVYNWMAALDQFRMAPWVGTGAGTHLIYGRLFRRPPLHSDPVHAHGDYLEMLAEYGVAGELFALAFLAIHIANGAIGARQIAIRRLRNTIERPRSDFLALDLGALAGIAALMAHSVVDFNMHIPGNALLYAFLFGILANPGVERPSEPPAWLSTVTGLRLATLPLGAVLVAFVIPMLKGEYLSELARAALRDKKNSEAIGLARKAIEAQPLNPSNYFYLGEANRALAFSIGMPAVRPMFFQKSVEAYQAGLKFFPQDENLLVRMAQSLDGLRRFDEAETAYQTAIKWDPNLGILYAYYAAHLHLMGELDEEQKATEKVTKLAAEVRDSGMAEVRSLLEERRSH